MASSNLVLTGTSSVLARSNGEVVDLLAGGQGVFNIVPLAGVVDELEADIVRLDIAAQSRPGGTPGATGCRSRVPGGAGRRRVSETVPARRRRPPHPSGAPAGQVRFAHPSETALRRPARPLRRAVGVRAGRVPPALGRGWDRRCRASAPTSGCPSGALFIELTTAEQRLVTRKNGKVRRMRELYPEIPVLVVYQRDFLALLEAHGLDVNVPSAA